MNADRLSQVEEVYHAALEVAAESRSTFLASACGADYELRREVESLLSLVEVSSSVIGKPPLYPATEMISEKKRREATTEMSGIGTPSS
jgi:hypothetical protein